MKINRRKEGSMTTKFKIIIGFFLMVALTGGIALIGHLNYQTTSAQFEEYRRLSMFSSIMGDMNSQLYAAEAELYMYLDDSRQEHMDNVLAALSRVGAHVDAAEKEVVLKERKTALDDIRKRALSISGLRERARASLVAAQGQYTGVMQTSNRALGAKLLEIAGLARKANNAEVAYLTSQSLERLAMARSALSRFSQSRAPSEEELIKGNLDNLDRVLKEIKPLLVSDEAKAAHAEATEAAKAVRTSFNAMFVNFIDVNAKLGELQGQILETVAIAEKLNDDVGGDSNALGAQILADNSAAQKRLLVTGGVGLVLGIACALIIVIGIVRMLNDLARFASAVARGDFKQVIKIREKGEIGTVIEAMKHIPQTLENVIQQARGLSNSISSGEFRKRLDAGSLPGSFSDIGSSINTVSDSYTVILDALTLPIFTSDKNHRVLFLNKAAQALAGGNLVNEQCSNIFHTPLCGSDACIGRCAMSQGGPYMGETEAVVRGARLDIAGSAFPLRNLSDELVGYVEVVTDLTKIKGQQKAIMQAVADASTVSDRVAAAAEELAAQVEQISRGTEQQRARVEATASAMTQMNSTVIEVARSASQASEQSEETRNRAEDGADLVNKVVQSINQVDSAAMTLQENMQELGGQAESIGGVMNVISDIADQTNLLALNAAIEAARAGEAGRGFAVVADEVRKLAEKTMFATKEVGANISAIQHSAQVNIGEVANAAKNVREATVLANSSGSALQEIVALASTSSSVVVSIATAAEEQSATSEEINRAVDEINRIASDTSDGMLQSAAAVQDLSRMAQELRRVMEGLRSS